MNHFFKYYLPAMERGTGKPKNIESIFIKPWRDDIDMRSLRVSWKLLKCVTPIRYARFCCEQILKVLGTRNATIVEACGGNGGDTIAFAHNFRHVVTIEKDPQEFQILQNNVQAYKLNNVSLHLGSFRCAATDGDVLYLDPPWGENYKRYLRLHLYLDDINIIDVVHDTSYFLTVIKVPYNYRYRELKNYLTQHGCIVWSRPVRNYYLIFVKKPWIFPQCHSETGITASYYTDKV